MAEVPPLVKHMTLAILRRAELTGTDAERFHAAFLIARMQCAKFKFIGAAGAEDPAAITLTPEGAKRDAAHRREPDSFAKASRFDVLVVRYGLTPTAPPVTPLAPPSPAATPGAPAVPAAPPPRARVRER